MPRGRCRFLGNDAPHFMTMTVNHWLPVFTRPETVEIVFDSWRYLQANADLRLHGYVILENHLHLVAGLPQIGKDIQRFKSYTARRIIDHLVAVRAERLLDLLALFKRVHKTRSEHQLWEEGSHPQRIEREVVMRQKLEYIHQNPVKRGFVDLPEYWRWSSARDYAGLRGASGASGASGAGRGGSGMVRESAGCAPPSRPALLGDEGKDARTPAVGSGSEPDVRSRPLFSCSGQDSTQISCMPEARRKALRNRGRMAPRSYKMATLYSGGRRVSVSPRCKSSKCFR